MSGPVDVLAVMDFHIGNMTLPRQHPMRAELEEVRATMVELIDAAQWALKLDDAGAMSDTARHNLERALAATGGAA